MNECRACPPMAGKGNAKANGNTIFTIVDTVSPNEVILPPEITLETAFCIIREH